MLQDGGSMAAALGYPVELVYVLLKACLGIGLWGAAVVGFLLAPMPLWERLLAALAAALLVLALPWTDEVGFALSAALIAGHWWRHRRPAVA
jgi:TRAP-type uncharacterized transport system fused permease subunit